MKMPLHLPYKCVAVVSACLFIFLFSTIGAAQAFIDISDDAKVPILTPSFSERKTAKIRLPNGLEAYLISDPRAEKSAAAMVVKVGSWEDPDDAPGMAHFVEHASFLGTEKYPEESDFDRYITQHGGATNASTAVDYTQYLFSVNTDAFAPALDRFARFFYQPLFKASGLAREVNAIDQEFARIARDDDGRLSLVLQALGNPKHPNTRFTAGNKVSLAAVKREEMIKWHDEHYSANLMRLVVYSSLDIATLKQLVTTDFTPIPNLNRQPLVPTVPLGTSKAMVTRVESLKDSRTLMLFWELPGRYARMLDSKPGDVVCYVLGDEGEGSLLAVLKKQGLADALMCAGLNYGTNNYRVFIQIQLTRKGLKEVDQVLDHVFQTIEEMRAHGEAPYLFHDVQGITLAKYQYQERQDAYDVVNLYAQMLPYEELNTFPERSSLLKKYDHKAVVDLLDALTPDTVQMAILAPLAKGDSKLDRTEKWTGTAYSTAPIAPETLERWKNLDQLSDLHVPQPNAYLLTASKVVPADPASPQAMPKPKILIDDSAGIYYYAKDEYYQVPQIGCTFAILTPQVNDGDVYKAAMADLYVKAVQESLNRALYPAQVAGLDFQLAAKTYSLILQLSGFSEHATDLLRNAVTHLKNLKPTPAEFARYKEIVCQDYRNFAVESPLTQTIDVMSSILNKAYSTDREKARVITRIDYQDFLTYVDGLYAQNYVKGMLYGNLSEAEGKEMVDILRQGLGGQPYPIKEHKKKEIADLSTLSTPLYTVQKIKIPGNAVILAIETAPYSPANQAVQNILAQGMGAPFFDTLRTQQQTGYAVGNWDQEMERRLFLFFGVESDSYDSRDILARFELFLEGFQRSLGTSEIGEKEFANIQQALANKLEKPAQNIKDMGDILGTLAVDYNGDFGWLERRVQAMRALTYADFLTAARQALSTKNKKRIAVLIKGLSSDGNILEYIPARSNKELRSELDYEPADHVLSGKN